ncbi:MAG TPA: histidine phosphatase family protein [Acidimicrobiales bacterium]|jgi:broad specificity phosphatase PhoE|nr:histidine phosphatase family protein [Acidimicrobiales bacterium]
MKPWNTQHTIWLVRHGESTWNASGLVQGQADGPVLTEEGRAQAQAVADAVRSLPIRTLVTSDLARAQETAALIGQTLRLPWVHDAELRERDFGAAQGSPLAELRTEWSGIRDGRVIDVGARPPGGESLEELSRRVGTFFSRLAAVQHGGDVLAVTHGGFIRVALAQCDGIPLPRMTWADTPNGGLWSFGFHEVCPPVLLQGTGTH